MSHRSFERTMQGLQTESRLSTIGLMLTALLVIAWLIWLFVARISVFEVTPEGRLEVDRASYPITAEVAGRVVEVAAQVGQEVNAGDVLVRLDATQLEIRQRDEEARHEALSQELAAANEELALRERRLSESRRATRLALAEERARLGEAEIAADFARKEAERAAVLHDEGQVSRVEKERLASLAERADATAGSQRLAVDRLEAAESSAQLEEQTEIAQLRGAVARLQGEAQSTLARIDEIRHSMDKLTLRAPRDGRVGELRVLTTNELITAGERLGTLLAAGQLEMLADFTSSSALGRVRAGQRAQMRIDGFPWTQYGVLAGEVKEVASEIRAGKLRVELRVDEDSAGLFPLRHGLTGTVEVEVERISPALLLVRTLGKAVSTRPGATPAGATPEVVPAGEANAAR